MEATPVAQSPKTPTVTADTAAAEAKLADLNRKLAILDAQHVQDNWR